MMGKFLILSGVIILLGIILGSVTYWGESHLAKRVTITVRTPDQKLITSTVIRLESIEKGVAIQNQTDLWGKIYFKRLTAGRYTIKATQIYCDGGKIEATVLSLDISGQRTNIQYFPCGNR